MMIEEREGVREGGMEIEKEDCWEEDGVGDVEGVGDVGSDHAH